MPLLHKQKFVPAKIPKDLDPDQEIFFSRKTREIFVDYDEYFERTILCNSLVWTCSLTGKQGLTFSEALDSEKKARKQLAAFPEVLEKALVYLITLTKRGNIKDLIDDIFSFTKDRYFLGENIFLNKDGHSSSKADLQKTCKIIDILLPHEQNKSSKNNDSSMMETDQDLNRSSQRSSSQNSKEVTNGLKINPDKIKYVVEIESKINGSTTSQTVRGPQIRRQNNLLTKDKIYIIIKTYCEQSSSVWLVAETTKFNFAEMKYTDFFKGEPPHFDVSYGRGQFSKSHSTQALNKSLNGKSPGKSLSNSKKHESPKNSKKLKASKSSGNLNNSRSLKASSKKNESKKTEKEEKSLKKQSKSTSKLVEKSADEELENELPQERINQVLGMKLIDMTEEEFFIWRDYKPDEEQKELIQIEIEMEKILKREQMAKEKERLKQEKLKEKQQLLESKKPKEDFDLDNLKPLPRGVPVKSKLNDDMIGDAVFILEFLNNFGEVFELSGDFPNGFNLDLLENALFSKSCDSALCNLLLFFLDSIFKCFDEENFEDMSDESEINEDDLIISNDSDDEEMGLEQLFNVPLKPTVDRESFAISAEEFSKLIKTIQGRPVKNIGLDVYTISEMLRLYFITSGAEHLSKTKFWYQQRGGYTRMDELGIDFSLNEKNIIKKLELSSVYDLEPEEKLKILTCLCHQLISQVRFRDLIEDNLQKLSVLKSQLRDLQTEENKRLREEASYQWKKRNEDRIKEKAKLEEIKTNIPSEQIKEETNACLENMKIATEAENAKFLNESNIKRESFLKKERTILYEIYELQNKCSMYPIGKDRYYRRYWVFKSFPGVFVEDNNKNDQINILLEGNLNKKYKIRQEEMSDEKEQKPKIENKPQELNEQIADLKDQFNGGKEKKPQLSEITNLNNTNQLNGQSQPKAEQAAPEPSVKVETFRPDYVKDEVKWSFFNTIEDIEFLIDALNERGLRESELKQNLTDLKDKIRDGLTKKSLIIANLTLSEEEIEKSIRNSLKENINSVLANNLFKDPKHNKRQATKMAASLAVNNFAEHSSDKYMEIDLRDKILDFEEQIFIGSLGTLKNADRLKWKDLISKEIIGTEEESNEVIKKRINILCTALLKLEQSVERRFLRTPLGEVQNTPSKKRTRPAVQDTSENEEDKYQILHNWEKSLMHCTNYSQVFVHLQSLDESIAWSKSAMNARCRICKKKGDAEKMLLCDKCDHGHHMYCLRPQLKEIPDGQWFCPECKPKDVERTPRKIRDTFKDGELYTDDKETEDDEEDMEEDETMDESDNTIEDNKSDTSTKKKRKSQSKKSITNNKSSDEDEENEEDERDDEEDREDEETQESTADEDQNDSDYGTAKKKLKFNGFRIKNKKEVSDEEMFEESSDEVDSKRKKRKRKVTDDKNNSKNMQKLTPKPIIQADCFYGRSTRSRKPVYKDYEQSDDLTETDDDDRKRKKTRRGEQDYTMNTSSRNTDVEQRMKVAEKLLNDLIKHEDGWPFLKPVSKRDAPDYFDIIKKPMDFSTIKNNINNFKYEDYTPIIEDIRLVFRNCRDYNEPGSDIYDICQRLSQYFEKGAKKAGLLDFKNLSRSQK